MMQKMYLIFRRSKVVEGIPLLPQLSRARLVVWMPLCRARIMITANATYMTFVKQTKAGRSDFLCDAVLFSLTNTRVVDCSSSVLSSLQTSTYYPSSRLITKGPTTWYRPQRPQRHSTSSPNPNNSTRPRMLPMSFTILTCILSCHRNIVGAQWPSQWPRGVDVP